MSNMASHFTGKSSVCSAVCWDKYQRKYQSPRYWPFMRGIHWWPEDSHHKGTVRHKAFPCHNVIMSSQSEPSWSWRRHQMETFSALLAQCEGNSPVTGEFPSQRPITRSFDVFFDLHLNKRLSKPSGRRWFETPSRSLWRHWNNDNDESRQSPDINRRNKNSR